MIMREQLPEWPLEEHKYTNLSDYLLCKHLKIISQQCWSLDPKKRPQMESIRATLTIAVGSREDSEIRIHDIMSAPLNTALSTSYDQPEQPMTFPHPDEGNEAFSALQEMPHSTGQWFGCDFFSYTSSASRLSDEDYSEYHVESTRKALLVLTHYKGFCNLHDPRYSQMFPPHGRRIAPDIDQTISRLRASKLFHLLRQLLF